MPTSLQDELKQAKPFTSVANEALLSIERTAAVLSHAFADFIRPYGITATQYNVLRILRGAGANGLCRHEVRDRLVSQVPDVTRLLDRLEEMGLVVRARGETDRRLVSTHITPEGLELLARLDEPVRDFDRRFLGHLDDADLRTLADLLARVRHRE